MSNAKIVYATVLAFLSIESAKAEDEDPELREQAQSLAMKTPFYVPLKFSAGHGVLRLNITNRPDEDDPGHMRPYNLDDPSEFFDISYYTFIRRLQRTHAKLEHQHMLKQHEVAQSSLLSEALKLKAVDIMMEKTPLPENIKDVLNNMDASQQALIDNPVMPLKFQTYAYMFQDKYAFPTSVVTMDWEFKPEEAYDPDSDLKKFSDQDEFLVVVNNAFVDHLNSLAKPIYNQLEHDLKFRLY